MSKILIRDNVSGEVREYGTNQHDALLISDNGGCLAYEHLQCGDGSLEDGQGGFSFVLSDGKTPEESDSAEARNCCCYANIGGFTKSDEEETRLEKIRWIANYYGLEAQSRQLMEECAELIQAINKFWRAGQGHERDEYFKARDNLVEEMADVQIMISQIAYLISADWSGKLDTAITDKLNRQIERIKESEVN